MFPSTSSRETLTLFSGNKIHCSPRDQSLSVYYEMLFPQSFCEKQLDVVCSLSNQNAFLFQVCKIQETSVFGTFYVDIGEQKLSDCVLKNGQCQLTYGVAANKQM